MADRDIFGGRSLPTETIREDIGFQGPHSDFNESITEQFPQISLPSYDKGRGGRENYQGSTIPPWYLDEVTSYDIFNPTENYGPAGSGVTSLGENYVPPPWWETQMGGKAYGPFHKSGSIYDAPQDYPGLMKLEPGQNYSYLDLAGNPMLNQSEWINRYDQTRSNPLIQDLSGMAGSHVPDEYLFTGIGDGNFAWDPWKSEDLINARHWLPEGYSIDPGIDQSEDVFQFRDFPWMEEDTGVAQGLGSLAPRAPLGTKQLSNLDNWDLIHLMSNGYTLEEAQEILERQLG